MTPFGGRDETSADADLVHHLVMDWRVRCALRRAPWELTTGHPALALCVAVVRTLEQGVAVPELAHSVRTWGAGVPSPEGARASLQCLGEAVSDLVVSGFGEFRPRGLDPVLAELAKEAVIPAGRRTIPLDLDALTRCPDRRALGRDLNTIVTAAQATGEDVTVAVMELDTPPPRHLRLVGSSEPSTDAELLALLATLRTTFGSSVTVYRVGERAFAVLAPAVGTVAMGEAILLATCSVGPAFAWGTASLHALSAAGVESPDLLLLLAEADLHVRRQDLAKAKEGLTRHRQLSVVSAAAAALLVIAGAAIGLSGATGHHQPSQEAAPAPRAAGPASTPPVSVPTAQPPAAPPPPSAGPGTVAGAGATPAVPAASNTVLASYQTPPAPSAAAPPAPAPPAPPPPSSATPTAHGHSGSVPGHLKVNPASIKHA